MFEKAFVISLASRIDRFPSFRNNTSNIKTLPEIELWEAVHGDTCNPPDFWQAGNGAWGCYRSHLGILEYCLNRKISSYVVFEDDAQIHPEFDEKLSEFLTHVPDDWEQIYLGGQLVNLHIKQPVKLNEYVYRPYNVNRTHCFAVSIEGMLPIYKHLCNLPFYPAEHIDHHLGRWHEHPDTKVYCPSRWLVGQHGSPSSVSGKHEDVTFYTDACELSPNHWLYTNPICVVFYGSRELLRNSRKYLHPGNKIDKYGYDISLTLASKMIDPYPDIQRWYNWIRSEVIRSNGNALPCLYHPHIKPEHLEHLGITPIPLYAHTLEDVQTLYLELTKDQS